MIFYFSVDEESELTQLEQEHQMWVWTDPVQSKFEGIKCFVYI